MSLTFTYTPRFLPARLPRICVAIVAANPAEMVEKADAVVRENPFLEFRLDYLSKPALALPKIKEFREYHPEAILVATCRRAANGGKFKGSVAAEVDLLVKAGAQGCHLLDIEVETAAQLKPADFAKLRRSANLILSSHDFRATRKLEDTFARMLLYPPVFFKVVST